MKIAPIEGYKTLRNWLKIGKKPKRGKQGEKCWTNRYCQLTAIYYPASDVRDMTETEIQKYKEQENKRRRKTEKARIEKRKAEELEEKLNMKWQEGLAEGYLKGRISILKEEVYGTAREWLKRGRKVVDSPKKGVISGDEEFGENWHFWYYHITDTRRCKTEEAERLLSLWDNLIEDGWDGYYGEKWW